MSKKDYLSNSIEEYDKKYHRQSHRLLKINKEEVTSFDKKYPNEAKNNLLKGKKWKLIGDTYCQIPKPLSLAWFKTLKLPIRIAAIVAVVGGVGSAIALPTINYINNRTIDFNNCSWEQISEACNKLENREIKTDQFISMFSVNGVRASKIEDIVGAERYVRVNHVPHKVRVLDVRHDVDENDKKLALTFEFANLISDREGFSLVWQWNDVEEEYTSAYNFIDSSIHKILCGNGEFKGDVYCASYSSKTDWDKEYKNKTVLSMIDKELVDVIKPTKKSVGVSTDGENWTKKDFTDKLFLLTPMELGFEECYDVGYGKEYMYYFNALEEEDISRIKKQVRDDHEYHLKDTYIDPDKGQAYKRKGVINHAGTNATGYYYTGGDYYLRSPYTNYSDEAYTCGIDGKIVHGIVCRDAYSLAPAFCI